MTTIIGSPHWRLLHQDGVLLATAGADQVWTVDTACPTELFAELQRCWDDDPPEVDQLSVAARLVLEELRPLGAVGPKAPNGPLSIGVLWCGARVAAFTDTIAAAIESLPLTLLAPTSAQVLVVVRTTGTLEQLADRARTLGRPHLVVDLAADHTITVGPLVFPGVTACVGCLAGRIRHTWGDPPPPSAPRAAGVAGATTAAGLGVAQVQRLLDGHTDLADTVVQLNLETCEARREPLLRLGLCDCCADLVSDGRIELPWT